MLHRKSGLLPAVPSAADRKNATKKAETNKTPDDNKNSLSQGRKFIGIGGHINSVNKFIILFVIKKLFQFLFLAPPRCVYLHYSQTRIFHPWKILLGDVV
jgi:hypothetical protein